MKSRSGGSAEAERSEAKEVFLIRVSAPADAPGSAENPPSHTEMALIYQSAAWILAGLLLAIVLFLVVAVLINKKKKWVQMSCYSAPKKVRSRP